MMLIERMGSHRLLPLITLMQSPFNMFHILSFPSAEPVIARKY